MALPTVRPFTAQDTAAAAGLLAARLAEGHARVPFIDPALGLPAAVEGFVRGLVANPFADGVIAEAGGEALGFLFGQRMLIPPTEMAALFVPPHSISIPVEGHAVAAASDPTVVYREMYRHLAAQWVRDGYFIHRTAILAGHADEQEAWVSLGFGRAMTAATRRAADPVTNIRPTGIEVHRAGTEDIDLVTRLSDVLMEHHNRAPIFWALLKEPHQQTRAFNLGFLEAGATPYFIGYQQGEPVAMTTFIRPGFTPPVVAHGSDIYLFEGIVTEAARSGGVGTAVLGEALSWVRENGFETCTLHFASGNYSAAPFWLGHGFVPVEHTMERHVDERVAWAR
ncbi:MAG: GNAT family N-acetyltransferase [Dehalococcoidia bacterium]